MENQMGEDTTQWKPVSRDRCLNEISINFWLCNDIIFKGGDSKTSEVD